MSARFSILILLFGLGGSNDCPDGHYGSSCENCVGSVRRRRADECTSCPTFIPGIVDGPGDDCEGCADGYYAISGSPDYCGNCVGSARRRFTSSSCTACEVGMQDGSSDDCEACPSGTYSSAGGQSCAPCTGSARRRRSISCTACDPGMGPDATLDNCVPCLDGTYGDGTNSTCSSCSGSIRRRRHAESCTDCPVGNQPSGNGIDDCLACMDGYYSAGGSSSCTQCIGSSRRRRDAGGCTPCEVGTIKLSPESDDCIECDSGYYQSGNSCPLCVGSARRRRAGSCTSCGDGQYDHPTNDNCQYCPNGHYRNSSMTSASCPECVGSTRRRRDAAICTPCEVGFIKATVASDDCTECDTAYYQSGNDCLLCAGSTRRRRANSCTECEAGSVVHNGTDDCHECHSGFYVSGDACPRCVGSTRRRRAESCTACDAGLTDDPDSDDCQVITTTAVTELPTTQPVTFQCQTECFAAQTTPWAIKCMFVEDPWDVNRPSYPCRGCSECETELCQSDCHVDFNTPWDKKCSYVDDPWDSSRLNNPCRGCTECETAMCQSQCHNLSLPMAWDEKCSYVADPWDASRPDHPCRGCVECDNAMCQSQCHTTPSIPWEDKCTHVEDVWDSTRPNHPCSGCSECLSLQSEPFQLTIKVHPIRHDEVLDGEENLTKVCLALATEAQTLSFDPAGVIITSNGTLECADPSRCTGFDYEGKEKQGKSVLTMKDCADRPDFFYFEITSHWPSRLRLKGDGRCVQAIRVSYSINLLILDECSDDAEGQQFFFLQDKQVWGTPPGQRVPVDEIELDGPGPDGASDAKWAEIFGSASMISADEAGRLTTVKFYEQGTDANVCVAWRPPKGENYPQMLFAAQSCDEHWDTPNSWGRRFYLALEGECRGNDSRCPGAPRSDCNSLENQGADCWWDKPNYTGECTGSDTRCAGSSKAECELLVAQGATCTWEDSVEGPSPSDPGTCTGNDSRCEDKSKSECILLGMHGASCMWIETPSPSPSEPGDCVGNDSRCSGSSKEVCLDMQNSGVDCRWEIPETTVVPSPSPSPIGLTTSASPSEPGECVGNDSRCGGASSETCALLRTQGADCVWEVTQAVEGTCRGNDDRCSGSSHVKCLRLSGQGADCWWESPETNSSGVCAGNDSRCQGSTKQFCDNLSQGGADCVYREDYGVIGSIDLEVTGAGCDLSQGVANGLSDLTEVPPEKIDVETACLDRRLQGRRLSKAAVQVRASYAILVDSDVPPSVVRTGVEMGELLQASKRDDINAAILSGVRGTYFASEDLDVSLNEVGAAKVAFINVVTSTSKIVPTSTSALSITTKPNADTTETTIEAIEGQNENSSGKVQTRASHISLLLPALAALLT